MKLEVGKKYVDRLGRVHVIVRYDETSDWPFISDNGYTYTWIDDGMYGCDKKSAHAYNLISEYVEPVSQPHKEAIGTTETHDGQEYVHTGMGLFPVKNDYERELDDLKRRVQNVRGKLLDLCDEHQLRGQSNVNSREWAVSCAYLDAAKIVRVNLIDIKV